MSILVEFSSAIPERDMLILTQGHLLLAFCSPGRAFVPAGTSASMASAIHVPSDQPGRSATNLSRCLEEYSRFLSWLTTILKCRKSFQLRAIRHSKPYASDGVFCLALGLTNFSWHSTPSMLCEGIISPYGISCPLFLHEGVLFVCEVMISEYEIQRNSWTMTKKMYVAGGNSADLFDLDSAEVLDPAIGNWPFLVSPRG
ncbi:hypothetical protein V6N13_023503 [Hibiscus sabdariffa]